MILATYPEYSQFVGSNRILYCWLKKALYGYVQASKLWYEKFKGFLQEAGYVRSEVELCLFHKVIGGRVYLLVVYIYG